MSAYALLKAIEDTGTEPDSDGSLTVTLPIESVGHAVDQLIRFGTGLEVLGPQSLREEFVRAANALLDLYG